MQKRVKIYIRLSYLSQYQMGFPPTDFLLSLPIVWWRVVAGGGSDGAGL